MSFEAAEAAAPDVDRVEQNREVPRRGGVVEPPLEGLAILHPAEDCDGVGPQSPRRGLDPGRAHPSEDEVGGQVAAAGDHQPGQPAERDPLALQPIEGRVGVLAGVQMVGGAVHDRLELVADRHRIVPAQLTPVDLKGQFDQDRHLHGAGRVESDQGAYADYLPAGRVPIDDPDDGTVPGHAGPEQALEHGGFLSLERTGQSHPAKQDREA